jgi:hypothetical protein
MGTVGSVLYNTTNNWKQGSEVPDPPANFPKIPQEVKNKPDQYLNWLGKIASDNPDPACRNYATIQYKIEYFAREKETNQMTDSANIQVDNGNDGVVKAKGIQTACEVGEVLCGAVYLGGSLRALGVSLGPAAINTIQKSGEKAINIIRNTAGQFYLKLRSGLKIPLSKDQVKSLMRNNANSASNVSTKAIDGALKNCDKANIPIEKLVNYALSPNSIDGKNKAKVFESVLGFTQKNAELLKQQILQNLSKYKAETGSLDKYGQRYAVDMLIKGPNGKTATVRTGWIIDQGSDIPRLTTVFVK